MTTLTQERNTPQYGVDVIPQLTNYPVKGGAILYQGSLAVMSGGFVDKGHAATELVALGRIERTTDNSAGGHGAKWVPIRQGVFKFENSTGPDAIAMTNIGSDCFIVDDQTVALTNGAGARSRAGKIVNVDSASQDGGVWVLLGIGL